MAEYRQNVPHNQIMKEGEGEEPQGGASFIREYRFALRTL